MTEAGRLAVSQHTQSGECRRLPCRQCTGAYMYELKHVGTFRCLLCVRWWVSIFPQACTLVQCPLLHREKKNVGDGTPRFLGAREASVRVRPRRDILRVKRRLCPPFHCISRVGASALVSYAYSAYVSTYTRVRVCTEGGGGAEVRVY